MSGQGQVKVKIECFQLSDRGDRRVSPNSPGEPKLTQYTLKCMGKVLYERKCHNKKRSRARSGLKRSLHIKVIFFWCDTCLMCYFRRIMPLWQSFAVWTHFKGSGQGHVKVRSHKVKLWNWQKWTKKVRIWCSFISGIEWCHLCFRTINTLKTRIKMMLYILTIFML